MFVNRIREVVSFKLDREGSRERTLTNLNPLHCYIIMHIPSTVLQTFLKVLTRRICLTIKSFFGW